MSAEQTPDIEAVLAEAWIEQAIADEMPPDAHDAEWRAANAAAVIRQALAPILAAAVREARAAELREAADEWATGAWSDCFLADEVDDDVSAVRSMEKFLLDRADRIAVDAPEGGALPDDAPWPREECLNRGPRIGEDVTRCRRSKGHRGQHQTAPSDGFGDVRWSNPEGGEGR